MPELEPYQLPSGIVIPIVHVMAGGMALTKHLFQSTLNEIRARALPTPTLISMPLCQTEVVEEMLNIRITDDANTVMIYGIKHATNSRLADDVVMFEYLTKPVGVITGLAINVCRLNKLAGQSYCTPPVMKAVFKDSNPEPKPKRKLVL